ncbi:MULTISPECIES: hypothetical protein [Nocardia]|uniref:hypothetical protein n=1 Tax=Nocardia TaxID=1817 RepID=UPI000D68F3FD|nr:MULTISPECIES: hypothetical protein [Nocardia]
MKITHALAGALAALVVGGTGTANGQPRIEPVADHVTCFIQAGGPFKANSASTTHIQYGFTVRCSPRSPEKRHIEVILWRHDLQRDKFYQQDARAYIDPTRAEVSVTYASECSNANITYGFHTQAVIWAAHGNEMDTSDDSDEVLLTC